jgi:hypothetical protein
MLTYADALEEEVVQEQEDREEEQVFRERIFLMRTSRSVCYVCGRMLTNADVCRSRRTGRCRKSFACACFI